MLQALAIQKKAVYPTAISKAPATKPGIIIDSAINAVQMAKCAVLYLPSEKSIMYIIYAVKPKP